jgi:hypothetical protein
VIQALDTNHDGIIEADEITNAAQSLKTLIKSGYNQLTIRDLMGPPPRRPGWGGQGGGQNGPGGPGSDQNGPGGPDASGGQGGPGGPDAGGPPPDGQAPPPPPMDNGTDSQPPPPPPQ